MSPSGPCHLQVYFYVVFHNTCAISHSIYFINITSYTLYSIHMDHSDWLNKVSTGWYLSGKQVLMPSLSQALFLVLGIQQINRQIDQLSWSFYASGGSYFRIKKGMLQVYDTKNKTKQNNQVTFKKTKFSEVKFNTRRK